MRTTRLKQNENWRKINAQTSQAIFNVQATLNQITTSRPLEKRHFQPNPNKIQEMLVKQQILGKMKR